MLFLIGGADKTASHDILCDILKKNKAKKVAIIPTATSYPEECFIKYKKIFKDYNCECIEHPNSSTACNIIKHADLVFLTGGDQSKLIESLRDTECLKILEERLKKDNIIIAGTSAGSMAVSRDVIIGDSDCISGLNLYKYTIDTHFSERSRLHRLLDFIMEDEVHTKGIGIDEDTVLIINKYNFEVHGKGKVYFVTSSKTDVYVKILQNNEKLDQW